MHRLSTHWWLSSSGRPVQALARRLRAPGAERIGDIYLGPVMRDFSGTLGPLAPTAVYASSFPYWHMHQLVEWGRTHRVPVVLHGAIHPDDHGPSTLDDPKNVCASGRRRGQHPL